MVTAVLTDTGKTQSTTGRIWSSYIWAGDYVTEMLGKGQRLATKAIMLIWVHLLQVPLTSRLQAFEGLGGLSITHRSDGCSGYEQQQFTGDVAQQYMNPYSTSVS